MQELPNPYSELSPQQQNVLLFNIYERMPTSASNPSRDYSPQQTIDEYLEQFMSWTSEFFDTMDRRDAGDTKTRLRGMLEDLLALTQITDSFRKWIFSAFDQDYDLGREYDPNNPDGGDSFHRVLALYAPNSGGIFEHPQQIELICYQDAYGIVQDDESDDDPEANREAYASHKEFVEIWRQEYIELYHEDPQVI